MPTRPEAGAWPLHRGPSTGGGDAAPEEVGLEGHFLFPQRPCQKSDHPLADVPVLWASTCPPRGPTGGAWPGRGEGSQSPHLCARPPRWPRREQSGRLGGQLEAGPGLGTGLRTSQAPGLRPHCHLPWRLGQVSSVTEWRRAQQPWGVQSHVSVRSVCSQPVTQPLWASGSSCINDNNSIHRGIANWPAAEGSPAR